MQQEEIRVRWGCHTAGGSNLADVVLNSHRVGFKCLQIFFGAPDAYTRMKLTEADKIATRKLLQQHNISLNTHFPYWMNLCKQDCRIDVLQSEMNRVAEVGGRVVVHTGSCTHSKVANKEVKAASAVKLATWTGAWQEGADILISHLNSLEHPKRFEWAGAHTLLLEPPAGEGKKLGWRLEQIKYIFDRCPKEVGFCLDTCHAFAAGCCKFDTMEAVQQFFDDLGTALGEGGLRRLRLIHLNDSEDVFGSLKDRHAPLGKGHIWSDPEKLEGLGMLWQIASQNAIDIVSEVGSEQDVLIMRAIEAGLNQ